MTLEGECPLGFYWVTRAMHDKMAVVFILILLWEGAQNWNKVSKDPEASLLRLCLEWGLQKSMLAVCAVATITTAQTV